MNRTRRVIHPLLLLEGKAAALRGLPQADRQDAKHLKIVILVVYEWLKGQLGDPRAVFRAVERLATLAASPDGVKAFARGIDLLQAVPMEEMRAAPGFESFFQQRLPQLIDTTTRKRARHLEAIQEHNP